MIKRQALALVHCECPGWFDGNLHECSQHLFLDFLLLFIIGILHVFPHLGQYFQLGAILECDIDFIVSETGYLADCAVVPSSLLIVADKDDLGALLECEIQCRGKTVLWEIALDIAKIGEFWCLQCLHVLIVDGIHCITTSGQGNGEVVADFLIVGVTTLIQAGYIGMGGTIDAHTVEQGDEIVVALAVDFAQLDGHQVDLPKSTRIEKEEIRVVTAQDVACVMSHNWLQLENVAHQQQLLATKGLSHITRIDAQHTVNKVDDINPHHRYLVDDDELKLTDEFDFLFGVAQHLAQSRDVGNVGIVG